MKTFTTAVIRGLLNQVYMEEISFSRMVEIMNERVNERVSEADKPCVEDIPKRKFKVGDRVVLKSGYKKTDGLNYFTDFDRFIGKPLTIRGYTDTGYVYFSDCEYIFEEDWLEPVEELKKGDLAIFWDLNKRSAVIMMYKQFRIGVTFPHQDHREGWWVNAIKFESKEQFEKLIKGEI